MDFLIEMAVVLTVTIVGIWAIRRVAFRFMRFRVSVDGKTYTYHRERFWHREGHEVTDPQLLEKLQARWREIEQETARNVAQRH